jgi:hypothetical protein
MTEAQSVSTQAQTTAAGGTTCTLLEVFHPPHVLHLLLVSNQLTFDHDMYGWLHVGARSVQPLRVRDGVMNWHRGYQIPWEWMHDTAIVSHVNSVRLVHDRQMEHHLNMFILLFGPSPCKFSASST